MSELNGKALSLVAVGSLILWSGIKGWSIFGTLGDLVQGRKPDQPVSVPLTSVISGAPGTGGVFGGSVGGGGIAETAMQYQGHAYVFGSAPGKDGSRPWDCSSFVNWLMSVKLGKAIPGYKPGVYDGSSHGPPTGTWGVWNGFDRVSRSDVVAGDIIVWLNHMGIATGYNTMISALNEDEGTKVTPIDGYGNGPLLVVGRYRG